MSNNKAKELVAEVTREHKIVPIEGGGWAIASTVLSSSVQSADMMFVYTYFFDTRFKSNNLIRKSQLI